MMTNEFHSDRSLHRLWIIGTLFCSITMLFDGLEISRSAQAAEKPNIILIFSDDAGYNEFGFNTSRTGSSSNMLTPNLDTLAQQSVVMSNGYVSAPVCSPSRAGLLTGQYQQRFGYERNTSNGLSAADGLAAGQTLISHQLQNLGYTTGVVGKWHQGSVDGVNRPLDMGFDEFFGMFKGSRSYWGIGNNNNEVASIRRSIGGEEVIIETTWVNEGDPNLYDPTNGRYLTDAFSEESVAFIDNHAADSDPFFLYLPYSATHGPNHAKQQDLDQFPGLSGTEQKIAAMTLALDRGVGGIMDALQANGIDDNTIVVFANDNGGAGGHDNAPLRGSKGSTWEGGTRVAYTIMAPGLQPVTFDGPVTTRDLLPTFVSAAGGDVSQLDTDGVNLMPFLNGTETGDPHEILFWRHTVDWAVRRGDWKLVRTDGNAMALYNLAADLGETTDLQVQEPTVFAELLREFTNWETTLDKPHWGSFGANNRNRFDHFVFRVDQAATANWSDPDLWRESGTTNNATMLDEDAYANAILEFGTHDNGSYSAINDLTRMTGLTFMLNEVRLTGDFAGVANHAGTVSGNALLFVNNQSGQAPKIQLDATASGTSSSFAFQLNNDIELLHDLEITGNGTQDFVVGGNISDFFDPRNVTKTGTSSVTLAGNNTFAGSLSVQGGEVIVSGAAAAIDGASSLTIGNGGTFTLDEGTVSVSQVDNSSGGTFNFNGGTLKTPSVLGTLNNNGGTFAPGNSPTITMVSGDYTQSSGALEIEIGGLVVGDDYDRLDIAGTLNAAGSLQVELINNFQPTLGQTFTIVTANAINGTFNFISPIDDMGEDVFGISYDNQAIYLEVVSDAFHLDGDLTMDGVVDLADWLKFKIHLQTDVSSLTPEETLFLGDFDGDLDIDLYDFDQFKVAFIRENGAGSFEAMLTSVPEPTSWFLVVMGFLLCGVFRRAY